VHLGRIPDAGVVQRRLHRPGDFCANLGGFTFTYALGALRDATGSFALGFCFLAGLAAVALAAALALSRLPAPAPAPVGD
jgi:nitrate/nitrite transporter NarK